MALPNACPKPQPRWRDKQAARRAEAKQMRSVFRQVEARDGHACRVCRKPLKPMGLVDGWHHHHLHYRSTGGMHTTDNVILVCPAHHSAVHDAQIRLSGNADTRNSSGVLCGVKLEHWYQGAWKKGRMI